MKLLTTQENNFYPKIKISGETKTLVSSGVPELSPGDVLLSPQETRWGQLYRRLYYKGLVYDFTLPTGVYSKDSEFFRPEGNPELPMNEVIGGVYGDRVYITEGWDEATGDWPNWVRNRVLQYYDIKRNSWSTRQLAPLPFANSYGAFAEIVGNKLVVSGSLDLNSNPKALSNKTYVYNINSDIWLEGANYPGFGYYSMSCVLTHDDGKEYVHSFGGYNTYITEKLVKSHCYYDPREDVWTSLPDIPMYTLHSFYFVYNNQIFVFGGKEDTPYDAPIYTSVFRFDLESGWEVVGEIDYVRDDFWPRSYNKDRIGFVLSDGRVHFISYVYVDEDDWGVYNFYMNPETFEVTREETASWNEGYYGGLRLRVDDAIYALGGTHALSNYDYNNEVFFYNPELI